MKISIYKRAIVVLSLLAVAISSQAANHDEAQFKRINKEYTINEDGSYSLRVIKEITLLTHSSFNHLFGETFVVFNPQREELTINECYTTQADGTVVKAPANAFNTVLPFSAANAPAYNHITEMVITHTGLEIGATIYLDYTLDSKPAANGQTPFDIVEKIEELAPVKEYTISFDAPASQPLRFNLTSSKVAPQVSGNKTTFKFKSVAASTYESLKPQNGVAATLSATTMAEGFVAKKYATPVVCNSIYFDQAVEQAVKGDNCEEKVTSILNYISKRVASSPLPFILQDNKERPLDTIIKSGYATSMEKAMLFRSMLTAEGISHQMILSYPCYVEAEMITLSTLKSVLFEIDGKFYSATSPKAIEVGKRSKLDNFFAIAPSGELTSIEVPAVEPIERVFEQSVTKEMASERGYIIFTPENINSGVRSWHIGSLPTTRKNPIELENMASESYTWKIEVEEGLELESAPFSKNITAPFGSLSISLSAEGNIVTLNRSIKFNQQTISAKEYTKFREFINTWNGNLGTKILFEID